MWNNTMSSAPESDHLLIEGKNLENKDAYITRLLQESIASKQAIKSEKFNGVGGEIFFDVPQEQKNGTFVISGKVIDKDNAYWRWGEEFTFSEIYDPQNWDDVVATIKQKFDPGRKAFNNWLRDTPEWQKFKKEISDDVAKEIKEHHDKIDNHIQSLDSLDFTNIDAVLDWLYDLNTEGGDIIANITVLEKFKEAGYTPKSLVEEGDSKEQVWRKIIKFILRNMEEFGAHRIGKHRIQERKQKYHIDDLKSQL